MTESTGGVAATSEMSDSRIVYLRGDVNEEKAYGVVSKLMEYENKNPKSDILLYVDSYGGHVHSFLSIYDAMQLCRCDIATIAMGKAMSCGQMIVMSGAKGKRFATPNATIMMHQMAAGGWGKVHEIENNAEEIKRLQAIFDKMLLKHSSLKKKDLNALFHKDNYFSAEKAAELGLIDHIIKKPSDLYSRVKI